MNAPRSIIGLAAASFLLDDLEKHPTRVAEWVGLRVRAHARLTKAGTLVFWARGTISLQHSCRGVTVSRTYIRPADPDRRKRRINELVTFLIRETSAPVLQARERLYLLAESRDLDAREALLAQHPKRQADYESMSQDDVDFWTPLIEALPAALSAKAGA